MAEKVVAYDPSIGYVSKESRTPQRASGMFVPLIEGQTPRRLPRLLAKRFRKKINGNKATISTPVREAVRKSVRVQSLRSFVNEVAEYSHLKCCSMKAAKDNKITTTS